MKNILLILMLAISINSLKANENYFSLNTVNLNIEANNAREKLEYILKYPEKLLIRFRPTGGMISNKQVNNNKISFIVSKEILFIKKQALVIGTIESTINSSACKSNESGYNLILNFDGSDVIVTDNIDRLEVVICVNENINGLTGTVHPFLYKSSNYNPIVGQVTKDLIAQQVDPILLALKNEISSMSSF